MTQRHTSAMSGTIPRPGYRVLLALGDGTALGVFVVVGLLTHHINPLLFPTHTVMTALPFLIAWALVAPVGGLYRRAVIGSIRPTVWRTAVVWTIASVLGAGIRATPVFHGGAPLEFIAVNLVFGLAFLLPWRVSVWVIVNRLSGRGFTADGSV